MLFTDFATLNGTLAVAQPELVNGGHAVTDVLDLYPPPSPVPPSNKLSQDTVGPDHPPLPPKNFVEPDHPTPPPAKIAQAISYSLAASSITPEPAIPPHIAQASALVDLLPRPFPVPPPNKLSQDTVEPDPPHIPTNKFNLELGLTTVAPDHPTLPPKNFVDPDHPTPPPAKFAQAIPYSLAASSITPDPPVPPSK